MAKEVEGNLVYKALHVQQRGVVRLVEDPASNRQEILKPLACEKLVALVAGPGEKGLIDLRKDTVGKCGYITTGRMLIQIFETLLQKLLGKLSWLCGPCHVRTSIGRLQWRRWSRREH